MNGRTRLLILLSVCFFLISMAWQIHSIREPEYGGDELWYATPMLEKNIDQLGPFEFIYSGPIKTIITYALYRTVGFNVWSVRIFTLAIFTSMVLVWSVFLYRRKWFTALFLSLLIFSLHADALFFAKTDINQPTFFNFFFLLHLIVFINLIEKGPRIIPALSFIILSFIESNLHIRNIWVMNGFAFTCLTYMFIVTPDGRTIGKRMAYPFVNGWPVFAGWGVSAGYFLFTMQYFKNDPLLVDAGHVEQEKSYLQCVVRAFSNLLDYTAGGRVYSIGFSTPTEVLLLKIAGAIIMTTAVVALFYLLYFKRKDLPADQSRLLYILISLILLIFIQYALTKPANKPWHGNHLYLLWILITSLLAESFVRTNRINMVVYSLIPFLLTLLLIRIAMFNRIYSSDESRKGFKRVIYQAPGLHDVRKYLQSYQGICVVPDWQAGRTLALENHYSGGPALRVLLRTDQLTPETIRGLKGILVIRPAPPTQTIPDWSDKRLSKLTARFEKLAGFYDRNGLEVYQAGHIIEISPGEAGVHKN